MPHCKNPHNIEMIPQGFNRQESKGRRSAKMDSREVEIVEIA